ncbi:FprA family A-type flavoprotein [Desulforamulus ruminis]|uniref:Flavodoxin/nitric oxide synthase n=1 Tax=Desulforamulus ruminis (strain ATCC 23193 / DSM 2154 / NCIMB 8452 / DL) TaxID=696281 RepID=F6DN05_DESRL|nr:flavodoxin domain-containing protein [Desulforamulus ruminis]AEG59463.1 flavodoxin/nitric oxide synthase [Desulforamulus ruminis DSM 2154]
MLSAVEILSNIYWVGAVDWNIRYFHGPAFSTHQGTTYNAYLIKDEKTALVDTVYQPFTQDLIKNIEEVSSLSSIDYIVVNHIESDHSGAFPEIMRLAPQAQVYCTQKAAEGLNKLYGGNWEFNIIKTGDEISLGGKTLRFIEAPMLHWPDSMFTYCPEASLLLPNDAFGQHIASSSRFDDGVDLPQLMDEAAKYYANILYPFSALVARKLNELSGLEIKMIAPSHGVIWRSHPDKIVEAYSRWSGGKSKPKAVVVYDTMWGSTEKMALTLLDTLMEQGVEAKLVKMSISDRNDVIKEILDAKALLVGSPTFNRDFLPSLSAFLDDVKGLKPKSKIGAAFGSFGWGGGALKGIEEKLQEAGVELIQPGIGVKWAPTEEELTSCRELAMKVAERLNRE